MELSGTPNKIQTKFRHEKQRLDLHRCKRFTGVQLRNPNGELSKKNSTLFRENFHRLRENRSLHDFTVQMRKV